MDLVIHAREGPAPGAQPIEVVERKGLGHPDTLCDAVAEHVSVALSRYYHQHFSTILHHNVDKVLLCGGTARVQFGDGAVLEPIEIYLAGRATSEYRGEHIPVHDIAIAACRATLRHHVRALDVDRDVRIISRLRPGSADLTHLFARAGTAPLANDTSCGTGFAPMTELEHVVLAVEHALTSATCKHEYPELGEDVKVMGVRRGARIDLTVACAFVARLVRDLGDYVTKKQRARAVALEAARRVTTLEVDVVVNAADDLDRGDIFLTVTGTSAEAGDDGEVGRGNRTSGLITPYRAITLEAAAGKNPVSHVGKLYSLVAGRVAVSALAIPGIADAACLLVSQIGRPVTDPQVVDIVVGLDTGSLSATVRRSVTAVLHAELDRLPALREALLEERVPVF